MIKDQRIYEITKEKMIDLYINQNLSAKEISELLNLTINQIKGIIKRFKIKKIERIVFRSM